MHFQYSCLLYIILQFKNGASAKKATQILLIAGWNNILVDEACKRYQYNDVPKKELNAYKDSWIQTAEKYGLVYQNNNLSLPSKDQNNFKKPFPPKKKK